MRFALRPCCIFPPSQRALPPSTLGVAESRVQSPFTSLSSHEFRPAAQVSSEKVVAFREAFLFSTHLLLLSLADSLTPAARAIPRAVFASSSQRVSGSSPLAFQQKYFHVSRAGTLLEQGSPGLSAHRRMLRDASVASQASSPLLLTSRRVSSQAASAASDGLQSASCLSCASSHLTMGKASASVKEEKRKSSVKEDVDAEAASLPEKLKPKSEAKEKVEADASPTNADGSSSSEATDVEAPGAKKRRREPDDEEKSPKRSARSLSKGSAASSQLSIDEEFIKLAELAAQSRKFLGAHISAAGGAEHAPVNCLKVKGQALACFLKNQRRWFSPPMSETSVKGFKQRMHELGMDLETQVLPHGSYLINVANPDKAKQETAFKALLDDLQRCEKLGIKLYNLHPGSTVGACSKEEGIRFIASAVNRAIASTKSVVVVLEGMAGQKNVIGSKFEDLRDIIALVEKKDRVGVCLDTCHLFAAGFDIRTAEKFEKVMEDFDRIVGSSYLKAMHINDSKSALGSGLDRHELIGKGHLGLEPFKYIMRHETRFKNMPLILETPDPTEGSIWAKEIKLLYGFLKDD